MIEVIGLSKTFKVAKREAGFRAALKSLWKREYKEIQALKDISFHIKKGEIVGYIGPNGAGKSTTIKVMSGILEPDSGKCIIEGRTPWKERVAHVKNIGVVFGQRSQLWWDVPVIDSFEMLKDIYKIPKEKYDENLEMLTQSLDLKEIIHFPTRQLSLGQRMRCEIAASLLHSPDILFLDEPTIGLDAVSKSAVRQFIKKINQEKKVTVILTTHDMNDIEALASRIIMIGKGKILFDGAVEALRDRFGGEKSITLDFSETEKEPIFSEQGICFAENGACLMGIQMVDWKAERAEFKVDTKKTKVSEAIAFFSENLELQDLTIENLPIEELIIQLYKEYEI